MLRVLVVDRYHVVRSLSHFPVSQVDWITTTYNITFAIRNTHSVLCPQA